MMIIRTVIIEDEENSLKVLNDLVTQFAPGLEICGIASHVEPAVQLIESTKPDLVFMDVRLADGTSFDVLRKLTLGEFVLVIVTAYDSYALDAIRFSAVDYLLKPVGIPEFEEAIERAKKTIALTIKKDTIETLLHNLSRPGSPDKRINIPTMTGYEFIDLKQIAWCESNGPYTTFHLANGTKIISSRHLGFYEELLDSWGFCRIHNATIVNMQFVKTYIKGKDGHVILNNNTKLEISQRRKADFLGRLRL